MSYESIILIVETAIVSKKWELARNNIKELLDVQPKKEVCLLMAKIEEGESDNMQKKNCIFVQTFKTHIICNNYSKLMTYIHI